MTAHRNHPVCIISNSEIPAYANLSNFTASSLRRHNKLAGPTVHALRTLSPTPCLGGNAASYLQTLSANFAPILLRQAPRRASFRGDEPVGLSGSEIIRCPAREEVVQFLKSANAAVSIDEALPRNGGTMEGRRVGHPQLRNCTNSKGEAQRVRGERVSGASHRPRLPAYPRSPQQAETSGCLALDSSKRLFDGRSFATYRTLVVGSSGSLGRERSGQPHAGADGLSLLVFEGISSHQCRFIEHSSACQSHKRMIQSR